MVEQGPASGDRQMRAWRTHQYGQPLEALRLDLVPIPEPGRGGLREGGSVLIHAGAGGSGSAAVQLAVHRGARVFATAGTDAKVKLCDELGAHAAINYSTTDFAEVVLDETGGEGVDIVFDN